MKEFISAGLTSIKRLIGKTFDGPGSLSGLLLVINIKNKMHISIINICLTMFMISGCDITENSLTHINGVMHANVNGSDFERSRNFYKKLGFIATFEVEDTVSAEFAEGLDMPPYSIQATPIILSDGSLIDLIKWKDPFDNSSPYSNLNHPGISSISLTTRNIDCDVEKLKEWGIEFISDPINGEGTDADIRFVFFKDPDGTWIQLIEKVGSKLPKLFGMNITGILQINVNTRNLESSLSFYKMLGFKVVKEYENSGTSEYAAAYGMTSFQIRGALLSLSKGPSINLIEWRDPVDNEAPYEHLHHLGIARIALETKDLDADFETLEKLGVKFFAEPKKPEGNLSFLRFSCFKDPDGTVIELVQYDIL